MKSTTIDEQINRGKQSVDFLLIESKGDHKLKYSIKSDSYNNQCYARAYKWDGTKWQQICSIHYDEMQTKSKLVYDDTRNYKPYFITDLNRLQKITWDIVK